MTTYKLYDISKVRRDEPIRWELYLISPDPACFNFTRNSAKDVPGLQMCPSPRAQGDEWGKIGSTNEQLRKGRRGGGTFDDLQQYSWSPLIWGYCNSDNKELHCGGSFARNGQAQRYITSLFMTPDNGITTTFSKRFHIIAIGGGP
ncbi:predicted protein [Histoplasma capsulatum G186AR]|uniref:Uncharacterized protein n=1 Tax=Ajellomyces capsulatus (strain G186AR / H82 / ATCC MYA-2454 / RMSCC 2432) TaxID=447093 RepID=C0NRA9_AJECG|nr:uncharacterized protein HCBG_05539 [Histoplasma capsulatum G186AR]EEH06223.1 predicted protein [Histoplasma capsulatum G186AR]